MPSKYCCVPKCYNKDDRSYHITTIKEMQEIWIRRIGNPDLVNWRNVSTAHICKNHFHPECIMTNGKLKKFALPTLNLPEYMSSLHNDDIFLDLSNKPSAETPEKQQDSTSGTSNSDKFPELKVQIPTRVYKRKRATPASNENPLIDEELAGPSRDPKVRSILERRTSPSPSVPLIAAYSEDSLIDVEMAGPSRDPKVTSVLERRTSPSVPLIAAYSGDSLIDVEMAGPSRDPKVTSVLERRTSPSVPLIAAYSGDSLIDVEMAGPSRDPKVTSVLERRASPLVPLKQRQRREINIRKIPLWRQLKYFRRKEHQASLRNKTLKAKIKALRSTKYFENLERMNRTSQKFFISQVRNQRLKGRGRRFTVDDKIFALSLFKQSGKGYRYLSKIFSLPSRRTLLNLLNGIPFDCGINCQILASLKNAVHKLKDLDKYCVLMFDEVALSPSLSYNFSKNCMEGLVDLGGCDRRGQLADHALVFMLKSIRGRWKQPLCFYFVENSVSSIDLVRIIKDVVRHVRQTGLKIVATISDQGSTNVAAINKLIAATREYCLRNEIENNLQGYIVDNEEIVHLYDPPHLLKGIRNALLTKDLHFCQEGVQKVASWSHIVDLYKIDAAVNLYSSVCKLTEEHVFPHKIKKMKVKYAAQIFSRSVYSVMNLLGESSKDKLPTSKTYLDPLATQTASALLFFDGLFDSVNGRSENMPLDKPLRGVVTAKSPHVQFWKNSLPILDSMYFIDRSSKNPVITPSLKNFKFTVKGFLYIWKFLKTKGFKNMVPRSFNQDPLENFFSLVRSHGFRNVNPTCSNFIASFKSLLINNLLSSHSPGSNCEEDATCEALDTLKDFLTKKVEEVQPTSKVLPPVYKDWEVQTFDVDNDLGTPYVAGYLAKKTMKDIIKCSDCLEIIEACSDIPVNSLIKARTYPNRQMVCPSRTFNTIFHRFTLSILAKIPLLINQLKIKEEIKKEIDIEEIKALYCSKHKNSYIKFVDFALKFILNFYDRTVSKILCGKKTIRFFSDPMMKMASEKYIKRRKK